MTDAFVSKNFTKTNATIEFEQGIKNANHSIVLQNVSCNCNKTVPFNVKLQCTNTTSDNGESLDFFDKTVVNNTDEAKINKAKSEKDYNDRILKYVYKKNETNDPKKSKGHFKNALRRRKRSSIESQYAQSAPLIVNHETSHTLVKDREEWLPAKHTANIIKSSDLADFNIETLHEIPDGKTLQNDDHARPVNDDHKQELNGELNGETNKDKIENKNVSLESSEENEKLNESQESPNSNERESNKNENSGKNYKQNNNSNESVQNDSRSNESNERETDNDENSKYTNLKFTSSQSEESFENSEEAYKNKNLSGKYNHSPQKLKNVDLDDFSYERIKLNKNGEVEAEEDNHHNNKDVEIIPIIKSDNLWKTHDETNKSPRPNSDYSSEETNEPTHINDEEVKPVVEITSEPGSIESEEDNTRVNDGNESLETLSGGRDNSNEKYDKLQNEKGSRDVDDVKDQFERVPLNYNHENNKQARTEESDQNQHSEDKDDEGIVDNITPKRYDDNLNIKFDDISIKLPEIKLPDDILTYRYEDPPAYKNKETKKKQNFFEYNSSEDNGEETSDHNDDVSDHHNDAAYDYYGNSKKQQSYKKHNNKAEEDDDDLYEKFVRERFGKRDTFEKRSKLIQDSGTHDPQLYKKVQNILTKTKKVNEEAVRSGDPKAGYLWTLEYGEKL